MICIIPIVNLALLTCRKCVQYKQNYQQVQFILNEFYVFITNLSPTKEIGSLLFFPHYFGIGTAGTLLTFPLTAVLLI